MRRWWRHNLATALIANWRAGDANVDTDKAYTFGLLGVLGRMSLLVSNPQLFSYAVTRAERERIPLELIERELYGFDHRDAGRYLVAEWELPEELGAVLFCETLGVHAELAYLVRDSNTEADNPGFGVIEEPAAGPIDPLYVDIVERVNHIEQELGV